MIIVTEEIDGIYYWDIIFTPDQLKKISEGEMINSSVTFKKRKYYLGARLHGRWDIDANNFQEKMLD